MNFGMVLTRSEGAPSRDPVNGVASTHPVNEWMTVAHLDGDDVISNVHGVALWPAQTCYFA